LVLNSIVCLGLVHKLVDRMQLISAKMTHWLLMCSGAVNLEELQSLLSKSLMIRRLKKDVLTQLPAKQRQKITFHLKDSDIKKACQRSVLLVDSFYSCEWDGIIQCNRFSFWPMKHDIW